MGVVLDATYRLTRDDPAALRDRIAEIQRVRRQTQPSGYSVGSVFANPPNDSSGRLIEAAGLKGFRIGDAEVSRLHANFILNRGHASAADVLGLMKHIQATVWEKHGVWLRPEVQLAGRFSPEETAALKGPEDAR
jgi:UDP-N-acetylmuramate dehydrogenase